ncbi:MAG: Uridine kinase [Blastococcus sp.]|nr:Uridine kinase [Blastococcus sp.]
MDPRPRLRPTGATTYVGLAAALLAAPPALGSTRLICVDGPAGSGKTTFAGRLQDALGNRTPVVHMDDLYAGWTLTGAVPRLAAGVLRPLAAGRPGAYHPYDWAAGAFSADAVLVPPAPVVIVEGCGCGARALARWTTLLVWVEAPPTLRLARGLARDGAELAAHWRRWQQSEARAFAAENTRARAGLRVDGTADDDGAGFSTLP